MNKLDPTRIEIFLFILRFVICELDFMQSCIAKSLLIAVIILVNLHNGHLTSRETAKQSHFCLLKVPDNLHTMCIVHLEVEDLFYLDLPTKD